LECDRLCASYGESTDNQQATLFRLEVENMRATITLEIEVEDDVTAIDLARLITRDNPAVVKANVYDPGQKDFIPESEVRFHASFTRHIGAVGGQSYGG